MKNILNLFRPSTPKNRKERRERKVKIYRESDTGSGKQGKKTIAWIWW